MLLDVSFILVVIDVVISLGAIFDENKEISNNINNITSSFYKKMVLPNTIKYPFYIWGIILNNKTHLTYSISCKDFDYDMFKNFSDNIKVIESNNFE